MDTAYVYFLSEDGRIHGGATLELIVTQKVAQSHPNFRAQIQWAKSAVTSHWQSAQSQTCQGNVPGSYQWLVAIEWFQRFDGGLFET